MDLDTTFRNAIRASVRHYCNAIIGGGRPTSQAKNKWKFENSADWHYGHFVGTMESSANVTYTEFFGKSIDEEKMREIEEIIEEESKELREYFKKTF